MSGTTMEASAALGAENRVAGGWAMAFRLARRELRGGLKGFRLMMACLALGVGAIAAIGSFSATVDASLRNDARALLGGDAELRLSQRRASDAELDYLRRSGTVSTTAAMRAMAAAAMPQQGGGTRRQLVELKSVDDPYPLFGTVRLEPDVPLAEALAAREEGGETVYGAVAQADLPHSLGLAIGDHFQVGEAHFALRAILVREPDGAGDVFKLGPTLLIGSDALTATHLEQPGSIIRYGYRLRFAPGIDQSSWEEATKQAFPDAGWRIRFVDEAAPGIARQLDRLKLFFTMIGLTALLVGGIGVANAVKSYLDGKTATIATLKCLGAPAALIFRIYLLQVLAMALGGIVIGLVIGSALPALGLPAAGALLPVDLHFALYAQPLLLAALYGLLTALSFALWPLARAREIPAAHLFRDLISRDPARPRPALIAATVAAALALAALAYFSASERNFALWFILGAIGTLVAFRLLATVVQRGARWASQHSTRASIRWPLLNFSLANLYRPGSPTAIILLSFGIGLTLFVTLLQIEGNLVLQVRERLPAQAPSYYFIDIQPDQVAEFDRITSTTPGVIEARRMPSLRARITGINGTQLNEDNVAPEARWAVRSDRGLTYSATMPPGTRIVAGQWWDASYQGPPLISLDANIAKGMGIGVGDTMTFNILGRDITATIANLREIDYTTLTMNFAVIFAPGTLESAPQTHIATVEATPATESAVREAVLAKFANVTAIRVKDAINTIAEVIDNVSVAARAVAGLALVVGTLVLAGAIAAGRRARIYDAVVLKVLGATRRNILLAYAVEYALIGLAASLIAGVIGTVASGLIITKLMHAPWVFLPHSLVATVIICTLAVMAFGFIGTWRALGQKASPILRGS
jgi:putative ABC transport system permease protein